MIIITIVKINNHTNKQTTNQQTKSLQPKTTQAPTSKSDVNAFKGIRLIQLMSGVSEGCPLLKLRTPGLNWVMCLDRCGMV